MMEMVYRYTKRKISYSKMPLAKLKEIEADILNKNPDLENRLNLYHEEEKKLTKLKEEYPSIQNRINEIIGTALKRKEQEYAVAGTLKKFFIDRTSPNFTEPEKTEIERLRIKLDKFKYDYDSNKYRSAYETYERLERIQKHISQREKKETKRKTDRAVIAAYKGKSRSLADQIKSELKEQMSIDSHCPYCGRDMGDGPHCDHIYPVSKGGLSTPKNMVYICSDCNLKKTDLTLTQFIKKYNFLRVEIERRLGKLGKDY
jgi:5-methylcytosine-specific restriction endonuclease McrA